LEDGERLRLEIAYVRSCLEKYRLGVDLRILLRTVLIVLRLRSEMAVDDVEKLFDTACGEGRLLRR
jgi:hypothetical protein